jgi:hypothetical protein
MPIEFNLTNKQFVKYINWREQFKPESYKYCGGGEITFSFTPTTLGVTIIIVRHYSGVELDLTDYDNM